MAAPTKFTSGGRHKRHHSWPPIQLQPSHLDHHHKYPRQAASDSIDDDPFSFFLSTDDDEETYISDWMGASLPDKPRSKSESPGRRQKMVQEPGPPPLPQETPRAAISLLTQWLDKMEKMYFSRKPTKQEEEEKKQRSPELLPQAFPISAHVRGRKKLRRASQSVGNRTVRSHSGRPRIWQEPGSAMYTLSEEEEFDDSGLGISI